MGEGGDRHTVAIVNQYNKNAAQGGIFGGGEIAQSVASCSGLGADLAEFLAEFVDATSSIDNLVLTRVERVRLGRYFDFYQRIILTFKLDGLAGLYGGAGQEFEVARQVVHNNVAILRMDAFFHYSLTLLG
jgi:hypothetical protein